MLVGSTSVVRVSSSSDLLGDGDLASAERSLRRVFRPDRRVTAVHARDGAVVVGRRDVHAVGCAARDFALCVARRRQGRCLVVDSSSTIVDFGVDSAAVFERTTGVSRTDRIAAVAGPMSEMAWKKADG